VEELELGEASGRAARARVDDGDSRERVAVERRFEVALAVVRIEQDRQVDIGFPRRPAGNGEMVRLQDEFAVLEPIDVLDVFCAVDRPDQRNLVTFERPMLQQGYSPIVLVVSTGFSSPSLPSSFGARPNFSRGQ
jgi:hypothetical protein